MSDKTHSSLDTITVHNPTDAPFQFSWNKEPYEIPAKGTKAFPTFLAMHAAKHLAKHILVKDGAYRDTEDDLKTGKGHVVKVRSVEEIAEKLLNKEAKALAAQKAAAVADTKLTETPATSQTAEDAAKAERAEEAAEAAGTNDPAVAEATEELNTGGNDDNGEDDDREGEKADSSESQDPVDSAGEEEAR